MGDFDAEFQKLKERFIKENYPKKVKQRGKMINVSNDTGLLPQDAL